MCGLVGIAGKLEFKDEATMKRLLLVDVLRGADSTGLAAIRGNGDVKIAKLPSHPLDLFEFPKFKDALNGSQSTVFLGHNRAATRGHVSTYNAHPFQFDHIIGAHNGTLTQASVTELENALGEKFPVDSQAIFAAISRFGIADTISMMEEGRDSTTGAWSLVWVDQIEGTLNFLRNKHRPMWYAYTAEFDRLFWASEYPMIDLAVTMATNPYKFATETGTGYRFWETQENLHYKFDIATLKAGGKEPPKPKVKELKGKAPAPVAAAGGYTPFQQRTPSGGGCGTGQSGTSHGSTASTTTSRSSGFAALGTRSEQIIHLTGDNDNPFAGYITSERFERLTRDGCSFCGAPIDMNEPGITIYDKDDIVLCTDHSNHSYDSTGRPITRIYVAGQVLEAMR